MLTVVRGVFLCVLLVFFLSVERIFPAPEDTVPGDAVSGEDFSGDTAPGEDLSGETVSGEGAEERPRSSIPEALLRPQRGESPRYPRDTVIGDLGRGEAPETAYRFAREVGAALIAGNLNAPSLSAMNSVSLEALAAELSGISPLSFRLGSGREEPDGAVSFLVRFLGREQGITGELYVRPLEELSGAPEGDEEPASSAGEAGQTGEAGPAGEAGPVEAGLTAVTGPEGEAGEGDEAGEAENQAPPAPAETRVPAVWLFDDLLLEEPRDRGAEEEEHRFDLPPYERFF